MDRKWYSPKSSSSSTCKNAGWKCKVTWRAMKCHAVSKAVCTELGTKMNKVKWTVELCWTVTLSDPHKTSPLHPPALVVGFLAGEERAAARTIVRKVSQLQSNFHKHVVMLSPTQIISSGFQLVIVFNFSGCPKWTQDDNNKVSDCTVSGCFFRGQMNISWKHGHMIIFQWFFQGGTMAWIWARATRLAKTRESGAFQKSWLDANAAALWESLAAGLLVTGYCYFVGRRGFILDDSSPRHLSLLSLSSFDIY
jgi:hypothetical protein